MQHYIMRSLDYVVCLPPLYKGGVKQHHMLPMMFTSLNWIEGKINSVSK